MFELFCLNFSNLSHSFLGSTFFGVTRSPNLSVSRKDGPSFSLNDEGDIISQPLLDPTSEGDRRRASSDRRRRSSDRRNGQPEYHPIARSSRSSSLRLSGAITPATAQPVQKTMIERLYRRIQWAVRCHWWEQTVTVLVFFNLAILLYMVSLLNVGENVVSNDLSKLIGQQSVCWWLSIGYWSLCIR